MRKVIFLFAVFLTAYSMGQAQPYQSCFGKETTQWNIAPSGVFDGAITNIWSTNSAVDTINGKKYYVERFYFREDTLSGKLWFYDPHYFTNEILVMDLELKVGDTFELYDNNAIATVTDIYYENNKKIIETDYTMDYLNWVQYNLRFIEGIGPNTGPFLQTKYGALLLCMYKDEEHIYTNTEMNGNEYFEGDCNINYVGIPVKKIEKAIRISIAADEIKIHTTDYFKGTVNLISASGKSIYSQNIYSDKLIKVPTGGIAQGIYIVRLVDTDGEVAYSNKVYIK